LGQGKLGIYSRGKVMDKLNSKNYVPGIKWRMGEYMALFRLEDNIKNQIKPLISIPPIEWDFEKKEDSKTVDKHLESFTTRYASKWGGRDAFLDFHISLHDAFMDDGVSAIEYIYDGLVAIDEFVTPVTGLNRSKNYQRVIRLIQRRLKVGLALRLSVSDIMRGDCSQRILRLVEENQLSLDMVDLIVDLGLPETFEPYDVLANALSNRLLSISNIFSFRNVVVIGCSIQINGIKPPGATLVRHEWALFKILSKRLEGQLTPIFGDYCTESPLYPDPPLDMRFVKAAGKIMYTTQDTWLFYKGRALRGNVAQMVSICAGLANSKEYCGANYSWGDEVINKTALSKIKPSGSTSTWKKVGFNHHITFVVKQLASLP